MQIRIGDALEANTISEEVEERLDETRVLLRAAQILVEWFTEEDPDWDALLKAALDLPYKNLELFDEWLRVGDAASTQVSEWTQKRLQASEEVARLISPLLERIVRYQPHFVQGRRGGEVLVELYGKFIGNLGSCVCIPTWEAYPEFAPPNWLGRRDNE